MSQYNTKTADTMRSRSKKLQIDNRTSADVLKQMEKLAKGYTPEWNMDDEEPDIGMALAKVYATQMEENIDRMNQVMDNYHTEFVNMLNISPRGARPAEGLIEFTTSIDTIPGTYVPKGTKLIGDGDDPVIYETQHGVYVTGSNIASMFMVDGEDGYITPIKGIFEIPSILPVSDEENIIDAKFEPFRIFGEDRSISQNVIYFYHDSLVDTGADPVLIRIDGDEKLIQGILKKDYEFKWYSSEGWAHFERVELLSDGKTFSLVRSEGSEIGKVSLEGVKYNLISLEAMCPIRENVKADSITFSSSGKALPIDFVTNGSLDLDVDNFLPFTDNISPFESCYIGMEKYFSKSDSMIHMEFDVSYSEKHEGYTQQQIDESLKVIKKKPKAQVAPIPAECHVDEICIEYFNGKGWKKLVCESVNNLIFSEDVPGRYEIDFRCPNDWKSSEAGAYSGRMLRFKIVRAENSFVRPCTYHYPIIRNFLISYSYEDRYVSPYRVKAISGTKLFDLTKELAEGHKFNVFGENEYFFDALYMGFSKKFEDGPISIMFDIEDIFDAVPEKFVFEYSSTTGFKKMRVQDYTEGMTHSGTIKFLPQPDMAKMEVEGKNHYWIRIVRNKTMVEQFRNTLPLIKNMRLNVVEISNINTLPEKSLYVSEVLPDISFPLYEEGILDAEVWVNELGYITMTEMNDLLAKSPEDIEVGYDTYGNLSNCFVRYQECDALDFAEDKRSYALDRIGSELIFGNGIKTLIPRVTNDTAVKIKLRTSTGTRGNTDSYTINSSLNNLLYINEISNPLKVTNGSDMEDVEDALERGAFLLQSRNRLISKSDYKKEIMLCNDNVHEVDVICEVLKNGEIDPLAVSCVLLLKDYRIGFGAFTKLAANIKSHLLENCELTVNENNLHITEPIFVDISVDVWIESVNIDDSFEIQNIIKEKLDEFLDSLNGWKIGSLPSASQIMMRLNSLKHRATIRKSIVIAKYKDAYGVHEMDLKDVNITPYMICRSGEHNVHVILTD